MEDDPSRSEVISLGLCDSCPLLWRTRDLRTARSRGMVGSLLGSLPRMPRQNGRLGRPLLLQPEEERLLTELHAAAALTTTDHTTDHTTDQARGRVEQYEAEQQTSYEQQKILALEDRKSALLRAMTSSQTVPDSGPRTPDEALRGRLEVLDRNFTFPRSALAVQLSTVRAGLSHFPEDRALLRADWPIRPQDDPRRDVRYQVFRDLRGRGFYLTSAGKFGGDFLVYPGDPLRFHAHFIVICLSLDESVGVLDVLSVARLGSSVKKTVLLCSPAAEGAVLYTSLQWSGMV